MSEQILDIATPSGKNAGNENFPVGSILIRPDLRIHVHAFYRFARMADDIADNPALDAEDKVRRLDLMETILLDAAREDVPVAADMRRSLLATGLAATNCTDLLIAFRMDATKQRYADWNELMTYCRYSASPVGRQLLDLHGEAPAARGPSDALCNALQVINHLQDCGVDYLEMDRIYVPQDHMAANNVGLDHLKGKVTSIGLRKTLDRLLDETELLMCDARRLPANVRNFRLRCECATIVRLALGMIAELRRNDPLATRVKPTKSAFALAALQGIGWACFAGHRGDRH
jgi:hydroxysqualene synthase